MKVVVTAGDKTRMYRDLTQKGVNSLITGISNMRELEGFQNQPFHMKVEDEVKTTSIHQASASLDFHAGETH